MYFDRIERSEVTELIDSIYAYVHLLEDIQFLIQYAVQVLPPTVAEASGEVIWGNILALQEELTNKREVGFLFCFVLYVYVFVCIILLVKFEFIVCTGTLIY